MANPEFLDELNKQLDQVKSLMESKDWGIWTTFLRKERRGYLQNKVNAAVKAGNLTEAQVASALMDDCIKQIELFEGFKKTLESKIKGASDGQ